MDRMDEAVDIIKNIARVNTSVREIFFKSMIKYLDDTWFNGVIPRRVWNMFQPGLFKMFDFLHTEAEFPANHREFATNNSHQIVLATSVKSSMMIYVQYFRQFILNTSNFKSIFIKII